MRWLVFVLLAASLAGCTSGVPDEVPSGSGDDVGGNVADVVEIPWGLESCRASWWLAPASSEALREHLPDGFEPAYTPQFPGLDVAAGLDTYLGFDAFECEAGVGLNGTVEPIVFGSLFTRVVPPDAYAVDGLDGSYFFRWEVLVPDQSRFDAFAELGLAVRMGDAEVTPLTPAGSPGPWQNTLDLEGLGTFTIRGSTLDAETPGDDVPYAAYTPAGDEIATWRATATDLSDAIGYGVWTVEPGSWVADVLGANQGVGVFSVGTWSITDARLLVPVSPDATGP